MSILMRSGGVKIFAWDALRLKCQYPWRLAGGSELAFKKQLGCRSPYGHQSHRSLGGLLGAYRRGDWRRTWTSLVMGNREQYVPYYHQNSQF